MHEQMLKNGHVPINDNNSMRLQHWLFLLFWMLKPFYLWESGTMQISDFIFVLSFVTLIIDKRGLIEVEKEHLYFILFVLCTFIINSLYSALYANGVFLLASAYYLYNMLMIISVSQYKYNNAFLLALFRASVINIIMQLLIFVFGLGRYFYGSPRYMGTFNDPNQFAFSMFTSFLLIYVLTVYFRSQDKSKSNAFVFFMFIPTFFLMVKSSSTGMLLGITSFVVFIIIYIVFSRRTQVFIFLKVLVAIMTFAVVSYVIFIGIDTKSIQSETDLVTRLIHKFNKVDAGGIISLIEERGVDKFYKYPEFNFFGSGDGIFSRFGDSYYEMHSTLPGVLFYYGIIPFLLLITWLRSILKGSSPAVSPVYLSLLVESMTLANQRQPILWMIIVLCGLTMPVKKTVIHSNGIRISI